jgi:hypothetical protein
MAMPAGDNRPHLYDVVLAYVNDHPGLTEIQIGQKLSSWGAVRELLFDKPLHAWTLALAHCDRVNDLGQWIRYCLGTTLGHRRYDEGSDVPIVTDAGHAHLASLPPHLR